VGNIIKFNLFSLNRIFQILTIIIVLFSPLLIISIFPQSIESSSIYSQPDDNNFNSGIFDRIVINKDGDLELKKEKKYSGDHFLDTSGISYMENVVLDRTQNQIKLLKINKTYDLEYNNNGCSIQQTSDGGYILLGTTGILFDDDMKFWLIKIDQFGDIEWDQVFDPGDGNWAYPESVRETTDGGFILTGYFGFWNNYYKLWLIKTNNHGAKQWDKILGDSGSNQAYSVEETADNGFIVFGLTNEKGAGKADYWLIKFDKSGNIKWDKTYGDNESDWGYSLIQTHDTGYLMVGESILYGSSTRDAWIIKTDDNGNMQWNKRYTIGKYLSIRDVCQTKDGGYLICGWSRFTQSYHSDLVIFKIDGTGNMLWNRTFDKWYSNHAYSIQQTSDGGFILGCDIIEYGYSDEKFWLIKTDENGFMNWNQSFGGSSWDRGYEAIQASDGGNLFIGDTSSYSSVGGSIWLIRTDKFGNENPNGLFNSVNLLAGHNANDINEFEYGTTIPQDTEIRVQFSKDNLSWYDSSGVLNKWDTLKNGNYKISFSKLKWSSDSFYYRMNFTSSNLNLPAVEYVNLSYYEYAKMGAYTSQIKDLEDNANLTVISWKSTVPENTEIKIQLRSTNPTTEEFIGPDGSTKSFYTSSNEPIWFGHNSNNMIQYKIYFLRNETYETPVLKEIKIQFNYLPYAPKLKLPVYDAWMNMKTPELSWEFFDIDSDAQGAFQCQVDNEAGFNSIEYDSGIVISNEQRYTPTFSLLDGLWFWRLRTRDAEGDWGPYSDYQSVNIDTLIKPPEELEIYPNNWTSENQFFIDWVEPEDPTGIKDGAYYYLGNSEPKSNSDGTWIAEHPFKITNAPEGASNIYLWLEDELGNVNYLNNSAVKSRLDSTPPLIAFKSIHLGPEGEDLNILVEVMDELSGVQKVMLYYKSPSQSKYEPIELLEISNSTYSGTIPGTEIKWEGVEYYIKATDKSSPRNTVYYGLDGETEIRPTAESDIDYYVSPRVEKMFPEGYKISIKAPIRITFNKPMAPTSTQDAFSIEPRVTGEFSWEGNTLIFRPKNKLQYGTNYTVKIFTSAKDLNENNLIEDTEWSFTTANKPIEAPITESVLYSLFGIIIITVLVILILLLFFKRKRKISDSEAVDQNPNIPLMDRFSRSYLDQNTSDSTLENEQTKEKKD
jgi:hypothetical protein